MAEEDYPQKFIRVTFFVDIEWTDEGPNGDKMVQEDFADIERMSDREIIEAAADNVEMEVTPQMLETARVLRGEYTQDSDGDTITTYHGIRPRP